MSMRRLLSSLAAVSLLTVQQAQAELQCLPPQERAVVEVAALRSELMVLATGCHDDDGYNAFIRKFQADLMGNEKAIGEIFQHKYGRRGQQEHDQFITDLANAESSASMRLGTDFCDHNGMILHEVLALRSANELASYAAGKDLVPASLGVCSVMGPPPPAAPRRGAPAKHH
jgi:hypothetical protein